jgi:predicted chitinase
MIQLTEKANYKGFEDGGNALHPDDVRKFVDNPGLPTSDARYGTAAAFCFWQSKGLNSLKPGATVCEVTKNVNDGTNGFDGRQENPILSVVFWAWSKDTGTCG